MNTIVIKAPAKNALNLAAMVSLKEQVLASSGPLLIHGSGDAFSAGLNLKEVLSLDAAAMKEFLDQLSALLRALYYYQGPTVAAVNGHAIAGGALVALMCDHRVMTSNRSARMGLNEVALGLRFPPWILAMAKDRMNRGPAAETVLLGAGLHSPVDSLRLGMVDQLADDPIARATEALQTLGAHPAGGYVHTKLALRGQIGDYTDAEYQAFLENVVPIWVSEPVKNRIRGFFKK